MIRSNKGFVLSMALFMMAVFLLIYAQIYSESLFNRQIDKATIWDKSLAGRFGIDAKLDLNRLIDQRTKLDQNTTNVQFYIAGRLPSPLSTQANLLRYQLDIASLAMDQNLTAFFDLNSTISDGNTTGKLDNGWTWKEKLNTSRIHFYPAATIARPKTIDVNITAEATYYDTNAWSLDSNGDVYVSLRYSDQNGSHTTTSSGFVTWGDLKTYTWIFNSGTYGIKLMIGRLNDTNGSMTLDHNGYSSFDATYSIHTSFDANTTPTRLGYVIPLTVGGNDANAVEMIQWLYE